MRWQGQLVRRPPWGWVEVMLNVLMCIKKRVLFV